MTEDPASIELYREAMGEEKYEAAMKAFVADTLGLRVVDPVFSDPGSYGAVALWVGLIGYTVQIYADFSGYSSMAIGSAAMLGFEIPENFGRRRRESTPLAHLISFWRI